MVSILLLSIAIIPMVGMFDAGLKSATTSGNYDRARAFANQQLENAKSLPYDSASETDVKNDFPVTSSTPNPTYVSSSPGPSVSGLPNSGYTVTKRYIDEQFANATTDKGLIKVTITVNWGSGNSISTTGVVAE